MDWDGEGHQSTKMGQNLFLRERLPAQFFHNIFNKNLKEKCPKAPHRPHKDPSQGEAFACAHWMCTHNCEVMHLYKNNTNFLNKGKSSGHFEVSQEWPCVLSQVALLERLILQVVCPYRLIKTKQNKTRRNFGEKAACCSQNLPPSSWPEPFILGQTQWGPPTCLHTWNLSSQ